MRDFAKIDDTALEIISSAERKIKEQTGDNVVLIAYSAQEQG